MPDFSETAQPYLDRLSDDPDRGPPNVERVTTSPIADDPFTDTSALDDAIFDEPPDGGGPLIDSPGLSPVDADSVAAAQSVFREIGVDALAFYKSFRFKERAPFPGKWGIFLIDAGIAAVAKEFRGQRRPPAQREAERLAFQTLLQHERYHFWVDAWALGQEVLPRAPQQKRYEYYLECRDKVELTEFDDEESLANFYVIQRFRNVRLTDGSAATRLIRRFFAECPIPYSLFDLNARLRAFRERSLAGAVANGAPNNALFLSNIDPNADDIGQVLARGIRPPWSSYPFAPQPLCPTYLVRDPGYAARVKPFQGPDRREFMRFVASYLAGQEVRRTDHLFYKIDNGETIKFPNSHDKIIRHYELKNVLLKAGMRHPEFLQACADTNGWKKGCPRPEPKPPLVG